ncbi:bifunctional hydroxymethylpyrimidine kinase/phosphomethylpyrimidine kinase [Flexithrix dorotheae]|uniref:bifunctional hydroxymethylpyrimidine kinase/phosphomethylpyrimidine kinase n=1 Tax=Flexithrix dorotheae TaxID=70993 RepID=UPI00035CF6E8|nr:bifunctional hydroxymethylpyrimidine kinase/phosphomethylpyrimidine kinase [Flexithrix dorotheae]
MSSQKVLAINSLPAIGNAGLKMVMSILGTDVIPVPSLVLSGIGSVKGFQKFSIPFDELLDSTLQLAMEQSESLILYVGYLKDASQIDLIREAILKYRSIFKYIVIDPVCGDHGKAYVPEPIIHNWGKLLQLADFALPNITEIALILNKTYSPLAKDQDQFIEEFGTKFPQLEFVVTSLENGDYLTNRLVTKPETKDFPQKKIPANFGGSGDAFASYFLAAHFFDHQSVEEAIQQAGEKVSENIAFTISKGSRFLLLG